LDTPTRDTISFVPAPSAASSTIRARCTRPAGIEGARNHRDNSARSESGTSTATVNGMLKSTAKSSYFIHMTLVRPQVWFLRLAVPSGSERPLRPNYHEAASAQHAE
jgi:hypothetical protein